MKEEQAKMKTAMSTVHLAVLCLFFSSQTGFAEETSLSQDPAELPKERSALIDANGMLMLDYLKIDLKGGGNFDLLGIHYLHQLNDWLYWGIGMAAPMVEGNYGGFFAADVNLHAQKKVFGNWFVDAGLALGAGAGGASISQISELSGTGAYSRKYLGFGYDFGSMNVGVNYAKVQIANSKIDDSTIGIYLQKPLSFSVGSYADAGKRLSLTDANHRKHESMVTLEYSNLSQIDPTGAYGGGIGMVSPQFSQFFNDRDFLFFGLELGYSGLVWYNQAQGGIGRRIALSPNVNLYGQLGVGSGGWVTDTINTGPGLVVYPKARIEYLWDNGVGASLSAGYLSAPKGTSRNWSFGAAISYHLTPEKLDLNNDRTKRDLALRGVRINVFDRKSFNVATNGEKISDLNLVAVQLDYSFRDHWYLPFQVAAATNEYDGHTPGYVEGLVGLGWQSDLFASDKLQGFAQVMYGMNDIGINAEHDVGALLNASLGFNYNLSDTYSIYGQVGKTVSLAQYLRPNFDNSFESVSVGLGMTYRFSLPTRVSR